MKEMFQAFDPETYADFNCQSCHGEDAQEVEHAMPNGVVALDPNNIPSPYADDTDAAQYARFMRDDVMPAMVEIMNDSLYDPDTGEGFGCFSCHERTDAEITVSWPDMDDEQRRTYMKETVEPVMEELFQEFDPERFAEFGCRTCHGEDARDVGFEMPNGIAPLGPSTFGSEDPGVKAFSDFMKEKVAPAMVELLEAEPYDRETGEGFGCFGCHGREMTEPEMPGEGETDLPPAGEGDEPHG